MNQSLADIQSRKQALIADALAQRHSLDAAFRELRRPFDACQRTVSRLPSPWLWAAAGLLALKLPIRRVLRIPILIWKGWRLLRRVQSVIQ